MKPSEEKKSEIYRKQKIDVEPVFKFLKANLRFTRLTIRGKLKVENEMGHSGSGNSWTYTTLGYQFEGGEFINNFKLTYTGYSNSNLKQN